MHTKKFSKKNLTYIKSKVLQRAALITTGLTMTVGAASAGEVINTTAITGIFADLGAIFPSIGNLIVVILPTILTLSVLGFVTGFFDKILGMFDRFVH